MQKLIFFPQENKCLRLACPTRYPVKKLLVWYAIETVCELLDACILGNISCSSYLIKANFASFHPSESDGMLPSRLYLSYLSSPHSIITLRVFFVQKKGWEGGRIEMRSQLRNMLWTLKDNSISKRNNWWW